MKAKRVVLSTKSFWVKVLFCFSTTLLLVYVLREVNSDVRPSMPFLYDILDTARRRYMMCVMVVRESTCLTRTEVDEYVA